MKKTIVGLIVILIIVIGGIFFISHESNMTKNSVTSAPSVATQPGSENGLANAVNGTPIVESFANVTITSNGINPAKVEVKKGNIVHFINQTSGKIEINATGDNKVVVAPIQPGKTGISLPLTSIGTYDYVIKGNNGEGGSIVVQ